MPGQVKKIRYLVPNSFTALSLVLGLFSIFFTLDGKLVLASWIIVYCALLDKLDGIAARLMKATSNFGVEFDSFADFVAFGMAPGFLVYQYATLHQDAFALLLQQIGLDLAGPVIIWIFRVAAAFYILCAGIRLATFNVRTSAIGPDWFYGFPSTYCGALLAALLLSVMEYETAFQADPSRFEFSVKLAPWIILFIVPLGILMLTPVKLPKIKARRSKLFNAFQAAAGAFILLFVFLRIYPQFLLAIGLGYVVVGSIIGLLSKRDVVPAGGVSAAASEQARVRGPRGIWWWRKRRGGVAEISYLPPGSGVVPIVPQPQATPSSPGQPAAAEPTEVKGPESKQKDPESKDS